MLVTGPGIINGASLNTNENYYTGTECKLKSSAPLEKRVSPLT